MRFYYLSIFSLTLLSVIYAVGGALLIALWRWLRKRMKRAWMVIAPLSVLLIAAPVAEEFWIAWNFGQLCKKHAGIFVNKVVEVEGFFNSTGATLDLVRPGGYRFIESYEPNHYGGRPTAIRLEFGDAQLLKEAIAKYDRDSAPRKALDQDTLRIDLDERTQALVYPKKGESWRITKLDRPTARYRYESERYGTPVAHKVNRQEARVVDSASGEVVGRYVAYSRGEYWFFIHLSAPRMGCDGPDMGPNTKHSPLIYEQVLKPSKDS